MLTPVERILFVLAALISLTLALVGWGFTFYLLVNLIDVTEAFLPGVVFLEGATLGDLFRLGGDIFSVCILVGMAYLIVRRFIVRPSSLSVRSTTLLHPKARFGIRRDSAIVAGFIVLHVGARFVGQSFLLALDGPDAWQPFASTLAGAWAGWNEASLVVALHVCFWFALGLILAFLPYFFYSKHLHLFFAPINFLLKPRRSSMGTLDRLNRKL